MADIYGFKLTNGEEIISRVKEIRSEVYILDSPKSLAISPRGDFSLAPVLFLADPDKPIVLNKSAVACCTETVRSEMAEQYLAAISKIITPSKNIIMG